MKNICLGMKELVYDFQKSQKLLIALGDENRQYLLSKMLQSDYNGCRVIDIAKGMTLSRPAISHHMQILKEAGIVKSRKEGRFIYYYLEPETTEIENLITLFQKVNNLIKTAPDRSAEAMEEKEDGKLY